MREFEEGIYAAALTAAKVAALHLKQARHCRPCPIGHGTPLAIWRRMGGGIFISYRQADAKAWAISLRDDLAKVFGEDQVFLDKDKLHAGNWRVQINRALDRCAVALVVIGPRWLSIVDELNRPRISLPDDVHHQEVALVLSRSKVTVIPVLVDDAAMPQAKQLPQDLQLLCDQQAYKIGDTQARRKADLEVLVENILAVGGLEPVRDIAGKLEQPVPPSLWKLWLLRTLSLSPLLAGILLYYAPINETEIEVDAKLSEFNFVLSEQQDLSDLLILKAFGASGLKEIRLPRAKGRPDQIIGEADERGKVLRLIHASSHDQGTITLAPLSLPSGTYVTVRLGTDPYQYRVSFKGSKLPVRVNVQGPLQVLLTGSPVESVDFGSPKPILLQPDENGIDLDVTLSEPLRNLLPAPLSVSRVSLFRIDERVEAQQTVVQEVSTVLSGTLRLESLGGQELSLRSGEQIQFENSQGEIRTLQLNEGNLALQFNGRINGMKTCSGRSCKSLMPTYYEWLRAKQEFLFLAVTMTYVLLLILGGMRWRKAHL
jgi:TIR domain